MLDNKINEKEDVTIIPWIERQCHYVHPSDVGIFDVPYILNRIKTDHDYVDQMIACSSIRKKEQEREKTHEISKIDKKFCEIDNKKY